MGNRSLPAHLQDSMIGSNINQIAVGGIEVGQSHSRISIKQNRFRLLNEQGQEYVVPQLHLDVIIVGANSHVSKLYYASPFNPAEPEPAAPDCYSDNGVGPSERALNPQSTVCANCPHAAWGSKITPAGVKVKACSDSKKLAVLLADNPTGAVYELRVPAATMENLVGAINTIGKDTPLPHVVLRMTFDATANYPKILFTPISYITPEQKAAVLDAIGSEEVDKTVGADDKPRDPKQPLIGAQPAFVPTIPPAVPAPPVAPPAATPGHFNPPTTFAPPPIPMSMPTAPAAPQPPALVAPPAPPAFNPMVSASAPAQVAPEPGFNPFGAAPQPAAATVPATGEPARRKRRTKAEMAAAEAQTQTSFFPSAAPMPQVQAPLTPNYVPMAPVVDQAPRTDVPGALTPAASVSMAPPPTNADLDALIGTAMGRR